MERAAIEDALASNAALQGACLAKLASVQRSLAVHEYVYAASSEVVCKARVASVGRRQGTATTRPSVLPAQRQSNASEELSTLNDAPTLPMPTSDAMRRAALTSAVHVHTPARCNTTALARASERMDAEDAYGAAGTAPRSRADFSSAELEALGRSVDKCGEHDWQLVVADLAAAGVSGRTAMECHRSYRVHVEPARQAAERRAGSDARRFWTPEQDAALRAAVVATGNCNDWAHVARLVPGRGREACLLRWVNVVDPALHKGKWTEAEDNRLRSLVAQHGPKDFSKWAPVEMGGRSSASCRERWFNRLDPAIHHGPWGPDEDEALRAAVASHGTSKWGDVARSRGLEGRTHKDCRGRWRRQSAKTSECVSVGPLAPPPDSDALAAASVHVAEVGVDGASPGGEIVPTDGALPAVSATGRACKAPTDSNAPPWHEHMLRRTMGPTAAREGWSIKRCSVHGSRQRRQYIAPTGAVFRSAARARAAASQLRLMTTNSAGAEGHHQPVPAPAPAPAPVLHDGLRHIVHRAVCGVGHRTHHAILQYCRAQKPKAIAGNSVDAAATRVLRAERRAPLPLWESSPDPDPSLQDGGTLFVPTAAGAALLASFGEPSGDDVPKQPKKNAPKPKHSRARKRKHPAPSVTDQAGVTTVTEGDGTSQPADERTTAEGPTLGDLGGTARFPDEACIQLLAAEILVGQEPSRSRA